MEPETALDALYSGMESAALGSTLVKQVANAIRADAATDPNHDNCIEDEEACYRSHIHEGAVSNGIVISVLAHPDRLAELAVEVMWPHFENMFTAFKAAYTTDLTNIVERVQALVEEAK